MYIISSDLSFKTNITSYHSRFEERTAQKDYIHFKSGTSCRSRLGRNGKRQPIIVGGCDTAGNIIHELYHTLGKYW